MGNTAQTVPNIKLHRTALRAAAEFGVGRSGEERMSRRILRYVALVPALISTILLATPGCVIKIGKGGDPDETSDTATSDGGGTGGGGEVGGAPQEPTNPFEDADPQQVALETARAGAAAYYLQGSVQEAVEFQGLDPANVDEATMQQLISDLWPVALEQANAWVSTLDPALFEAQTKLPPPECYDLGCPNSVICASEYYKKNVACFLQACGDAKCSTCPDWFGPLKNLAIRGWCSHVCKDGTTIVGSAALVITRPFDIHVKMCIVP